MTCTIYREGKGTIEHGIECESTTCEADHLEGLLAAGWVIDPPGYVRPEKAVEETEEEPEGEWLDGDDVLQKQHAEIALLTEENERLTEEVDFLKKVETNLTAQIKKLNELLGAKDDPVNETPEAPEATGGDATEEEGEDAANALHPVRIAAKEAGVEGWDTKRIATLQKVLEA